MTSTQFTAEYNRRIYRKIAKTVGFQLWTPAQAGVVDADARDLVAADLACVGRVCSDSTVQYRLFI